MLALPLQPGAPVQDLEAWRRRRRAADVTARIGMAVFLGSWAMMFAALFVAYGLVRARAPTWPPLDLPRLPLLLPGLNTAVMAASSAGLVVARRRLGAGRPRRAARWLALAAALGVVFLGLQLLVWAGLWRAGLQPGGGPYPSAFYALTAVHALHVAVGLAALALLGARAAVARLTGLALDLWAMYWHAVGAVWLVLYLAVYVG